MKFHPKDGLGVDLRGLLRRTDTRGSATSFPYMNHNN